MMSSPGSTGGPSLCFMSEKIRFLTDDGVTIVGEYFAGLPGRTTVLLLHMMPATKESWRPLAAKCSARGFSTLAIDFRGHGESVSGPEGRMLDFRDFSPEEHCAGIRDVEAAAQWLHDAHGVAMGRITVIGASIGANLALQFAAEHHAIPAAVALSPGLDYRGVTTEDKVLAFAPAQKLMLAAAADDDYSFETIGALEECKPDAVVKKLSGAGHGTDMFAAEPGLMDEIIAWIEQG